MDRIRHRDGVDRADRPVGQLIHTSQHLNGSHSCEAQGLCGPLPPSLIAAITFSNDTAATVLLATHPRLPGAITSAQVGCHASRSMRPRVCPNRAQCQVALGELQDEVPRMPPVLNSRCWRLVRDQRWTAGGRTSRRRRLPRLYAMTPKSNRTSLARKRWQERRVQFTFQIENADYHPSPRRGRG